MSAAALWLAAIVLSRQKTLSPLNLQRHGDECVQFSQAHLPESATAVSLIIDPLYLNLATIWLSQDPIEEDIEDKLQSWICCESLLAGYPHVWDETLMGQAASSSPGFRF